MMSKCHFILSDSGGVQEETSYLGIPCTTLRPNTERPVTITHGTNVLIQTADLPDAVFDALSNKRNQKPEIPMWDGRAAIRVVDSLKLHCGVR